MTADPHTVNSAPRSGLSAPESASDPLAGVSRRREGLSGPQTGAEGFRSSAVLRRCYPGQVPAAVLERALRMLADADGHLEPDGRIKRGSRPAARRQP